MCEVENRGATVLRLRPAQERGHTRTTWLDSRHSFSFADYHDPAHMGFSVLRVINDDTVAPGGGFATHGHRDMEIISYVHQGTLEHKDSLGNVAQVRAGEVQRMSAGTGVRHSEYNPSDTEPVRFLQIWILPREQNLAPGYEQRMMDYAPGQWKRLVSPRGEDGALHINQDAVLFAAHPRQGESLEYAVPAARRAYLHVVKGKVQVNGVDLAAGDAVAVEDESRVAVGAATDAELLLFDLP
jgi:redox-sensitive bicupin YhaK (pirin superfamily)